MEAAGKLQLVKDIQPIYPFRRMGNGWYIMIHSWDSIAAMNLPRERSADLTQTLPHGASSDYPRGVNAQAVADPAGWLANGQAVLLSMIIMIFGR